MYTITPTNNDWFNYLKNAELNSQINFWTPTPWNPRDLKSGDKFYFMLKSPVRKIGGFGEFVMYENLTLLQAWKRFGYKNGCESLEVLKNVIQSYIDRNSRKFGGQEIDVNNYKIGCIILDNCQFWDEQDYIDNDDVSLFQVKYKYFSGDSEWYKDSFADEFSIIQGEKNKRYIQSIARAGQSSFKGKILRAYNNRCCISNEETPELLQAAHIQRYIDNTSHHVQNGLLLRVDLHCLYDSGLIYIDENYTVHVSSTIKYDYYRKFHGTKISLPSLTQDKPSIEALQLRKSDFRS